ncbi:MAG: class I SAM-dependent methyltransferase [Burkholderiaceae bacterium]
MSSFKDELLEIASFKPYPFKAPSAWLGHLPFAAWLTRNLKPATIVELGSHWGHSYFTFCQAVSESKLDTKCYAVDTWQGDEHAGNYGDEVYAHVDAHNQANYSNFSQLLRMTFDEALKQIPDGSVELLHIDGLHTYEAVKHDFDTWLPKLAPGAVVLFHDTNVHDREFGVWQLWAELLQRYPNNLEFLHSHGLGVLQLNGATAAKKLTWLDAAYIEKQQIKDYFSAIGSRQVEIFERNTAKAELILLNDALKHSNGLVVDLNQELIKNHENAVRHIEKLEGDMEQRTKELITDNKIKSSLELEDHRILKSNLELELEDHRILESNLELELEDHRILESNLELELNEYRIRLRDIKQSSSWRITLPLREVRTWIATPKKQAKRYIKWGARLARGLYQFLPLSESAKLMHKNALNKHFPRLLAIGGSHAAITQKLVCPKIESFVPEKITNPVEFAKSVEISLSPSPTVSIIIPVYGQIDYTLRCLASIAEHSTQVSFEVIVVDDCSLDTSASILPKVNGIRFIRNTENQGFIRSCNTGAGAARGEYLCFLNNDTKVTAGWLDELMRTFEVFPGTGLVGSKLVYPDGRLQEAGGIVWQDGSAWNFGRYQDPSQPIYNYAREVDYCSGASIMVPTVLFKELGGFDEHYLPAYCEDCDIALKIRDKGYRVIYQPLSTVIHFEGVTSGVDTSKGTKAYQVENTKKLYTRWGTRLKNHQLAGVDVDNAKDRAAKRRVLVIDHCTPTPNKDAGSLITFNMMLLLREMDFQVTFIPENDFLYQSEYTTALQRAGIEVLYAPYVTSVEQHIKKYGKRYALVFMYRPIVYERHFGAIRQHCPQAKVLFHTVDLHFLRMSRQAVLQSNADMQQAANSMKRLELSAICAVDASIVVSTTELQLLRTDLPTAKLHVFPLIMDVEGASQPFADRRDIVFVGGYQHAPNVDAVKYFVAEVMPMLRKRLPSVRFFAVGSHTPAEIYALACEDVVVTGFVDDITPLLGKMRISVAPLRYGAGIKGKIGSAMAVGLPVVATPLAAEGMSLQDGKTILVAEGAEQFAETIVKLYQSESLWNQISQNSLQFAEKTWGAEAAWQALHLILDDLGLSSVRGKYPLSLYASLDATQTANKKTVNELVPIARVRTRKEYEAVLESNEVKQSKNVEANLLQTTITEKFSMDGYCVPCNKKVSFLVDMQSGGQRQETAWIPNWRERLGCPSCQMSNRQRLMAALITQNLDAPHKKHVYFMEHVTPIYKWAINTFMQHDIVGSEYLGHEYKSGDIIQGIRHEDVENLSFSDASLDLIVSNDVFEHVPNPAQAFAECARVLNTEGTMLATIPFHSNADKSIIRSKIVDGQLEHYLTQSYHGNPVSADGSLVFTDFGWDLLQEMRDAGFTDVVAEVYVSIPLGHLGGGQLVFRLTK